MSTAAEIELKFPLTSPLALDGMLPHLGFALQTPRTFEANTLYDTPDRSLRDRHELLRLRTYGDRHVVTHKRTAAGSPDDGRYKTRIETESVVDDPAALAEIFTRLGYAPVFCYEKFRTEWQHGDTGHHLVVDETPIGTWAELEGTPAWIDSMLVHLRIDPASTTIVSYGKLFTDWNSCHGGNARNLTFAECAAQPLVDTAQLAACC